MSEEIIIDGVNVKDCKRRIGKNNYCRYFKSPCADNNFNCIWKQHERLKEENAKLLFGKGILVEFCNKLTKIIDEKKENEAELYDKNVQLQQENEELKARFNELYNNSEQLANKYNKYGGNKENELVEIINKTTDKMNKYKQQIEAYQLSENEAKEIIAELEYKNKDYLKQLDALKPENVYLHKTIKKYEQTLKEIKEISEPVKKDICNNCGWQDSDCCEPEGCACNEFITILHKIDEVLK